MTHNERIIDQFSENINWNALSYIISKLLTTALSFILYKILSTTDFSLWANIQSIIFLLLLWLDGGFRKAIPRFIPEFSQDAHLYTRFITTIFFFRIVLLICSLPIFYFISCSLVPHSLCTFYFITGSIFCVEGIISLLRIFFYAHLWSRQFNSIYTVMVMGEMGFNAFL